jgi:glycosyltransferase involved in cell wall biosynthesis
VWQNEPAPLALQEMWVDEMGPRTLDLPRYLQQRCDDLDAMVFFTYLYYPTIRGLEAVAGRVPTLFHPTAHVEPHMTVPIFDRLFRLPDAYGFLTPEESDLVSTRFGDPPVSDVLGVGVDLDVSGDGERFRRTFGIGDDPYLLYLGRVDPGKGSLEMFDYFVELKRRTPGPLKLVIVGDPVLPLPPHPDVVTTGFVSEQTKNDAIAGCTVFLQPSYFESFSMALTEAWALRRPALVQGRCDVLAGQARRSAGALSYTGFAEFEAMVELLVGDPALLSRLGEAGHTYVEQHYRWDDLMERYEALLSRTIEQFRRRRSAQPR